MADVTTSKNNGCKFPDHYGHLTYVYSKPLLKPLYNIGITPNMITTLRLGITILMLYLLWNQTHALWAIPLYLAVYYLDAVDGSLARSYNQCSTIGKYYDGVVDVLGYIGIISILIYHVPFPIVLYYIIFVIFCMLYNNYGLYIGSDGCKQPSKLHYLTGQLIFIIIGILIIYYYSKDKGN